MDHHPTPGVDGDGIIPPHEEMADGGGDPDRGDASTLNKDAAGINASRNVGGGGGATGGGQGGNNGSTVPPVGDQVVGGVGDAQGSRPNAEFLDMFAPPAGLRSLVGKASGGAGSKSAPPQQPQQPVKAWPAAGTNGVSPPHLQQQGSAAVAPLNVVVVGELNRAGSNELLELLSSIQQSYALYEPFRHFKYAGTLPLEGSFATLFGCQFADDVGTASKVVWPGLSRQVAVSQLLGEWREQGVAGVRHALAGVLEGHEALPADQTTVDAVQLRDRTSGVNVSLPEYTSALRVLARSADFRTAHSLRPSDAQHIGAFCRQARVRVVKTVRFTGYVRLFPAQIRDTVKVGIHLLHTVSGR
jgi:hypothetical protein